MSPTEARIALANLIARLIDEHGMDYEEFASKTSFGRKAAVSRYLGGYSRLRPHELLEVIELLGVDASTEREMISLCLCQFYGAAAIELMKIYDDREDDEPFKL